jgi:hypothetical protein
MTRNFTVMQKIPLQIRVGRREKFEVDSSPLTQSLHHSFLVVKARIQLVMPDFQ